MTSSRWWLALIGIFLVAANQRAAITSLGPVLEDVQQDLALQASTAGVLVSVPLIAFGVVSPLTPWISRRLGLLLTVNLSLAAVLVGIVLRSVVPGWGLWLGTILIGVGIAVTNVLLPVLVKQDFPTRIGSVTGQYSAVQSLVGALASGIAVPVAEIPGSSWRWSLGIWAGVAVIALAIWLPRLSRARMSRTQVNPTSVSPNSMSPNSMSPPGREGVEPHRSVEPASETPSTSTTSTSTSPAAETSRLSMWLQSDAWFISLFMGVQSTFFYFMVTWWPSVHQSFGYSPQEAGFNLLLFLLIGTGGNMFASIALQRGVRPRILAFIGTLANLTALVTALYFPAPVPMALASGISGFGAGICIVVALSLFGLRTSNPHFAGQLSAMGQTVGYLLAAIAPWVLGLTFDFTLGWKLALFVVAGLQVIQLVLSLGATRRHTIA